MKYGICNLSVIPARKEPSDKSEMVTQLLFGELFEILAQKESWICIKTHYDNYECWIDIKQHQPLHEEIFFALAEAKTGIAQDLIGVIKNNESGEVFPALAGSSLPNLKGNQFRIHPNTFTYEGQCEVPKKTKRVELVETAYLFLNTPYLWGGRSPFGMDCSGFTQIVLKMNGVTLPRDGYQQGGIGTDVGFVEEAEQGDLAFFDNKEGKITHVGIILSENKIIHASGKVRVDTFDHNGIFNIESEKYTHKLRIIKKII